MAYAIQALDVYRALWADYGLPAGAPRPRRGAKPRQARRSLAVVTRLLKGIRESRDAESARSWRTESDSSSSST
jgi:hypothetical protein